MGLSADDYAKMTENIRRDAEKKQERKMHVGSNNLSYQPV